MPSKRKPKKKVLKEIQTGDESPVRKGTSLEKKKRKDEQKQEEIIQVCGGYTPVRKLGEGAYGTTWKATKGAKTFAVKISKPQKAAKNVPIYAQDVLKEIDLFTRLKHPNVMESINQIYISPSQICYFMPIMSITIQDLTYRDEQISNKFSIFKKMLCGLAYLHTNFVIHCDLKPGNVMYNPSTNEVRIIDYGLAVILTSSKMVKFDGPFASVSFRPPEIIAMEIYERGPHLVSPVKHNSYYFGPEVDVYAMGWIGLEFLYGVSPPAHGNPIIMLENLRAIGCQLGPDFVVGYRQPGSDIPIEWDRYQAEMADWEPNKRPDLINIQSPNFDYIYEVAKSNAKFSLEYLPLMASMVLKPPKERPTAMVLVDTLSNEDCQKIIISYPEFGPIEYSESFSPQDRLMSVQWIDEYLRTGIEIIGSKNIDGVILEAIDIFDRLSMIVLPEKSLDRDENNRLNAAVAVYLAIQLMTNWGIKFLEMAKEIDVLPEKFSNQITRSIISLKSRLFRPTLDQYTNVKSKDALEILKSNLSPRNVVML